MKMQNLNAKPLTYFILTMTRRGRYSYQPDPTRGLTRVEGEQPSHPRLYSQQVVEVGHEPHLPIPKSQVSTSAPCSRRPGFPRGGGFCVGLRHALLILLPRDASLLSGSRGHSATCTFQSPLASSPAPALPGWSQLSP